MATSSGVLRGAGTTDEAPGDRGICDPPEACRSGGRNAAKAPTSTAMPRILCTEILHSRMMDYLFTPGRRGSQRFVQRAADPIGHALFARTTTLRSQPTPEGPRIRILTISLCRDKFLCRDDIGERHDTRAERCIEG